MELKQKQARAIEMKYQGFEYPDIAKEVGTTVPTLNSWFKTGGILELQYREFAKQHNDERVANALEILKETTQKAAQAIQDIVHRAVNRVEELKILFEKEQDLSKKSDLFNQLQKAEDRLIELSEKTLDRGGLGIIRRVETKKVNEEDREEVIRGRLKKAGIDPSRIRLISPVPTATDQGVRA